MDHYRDHRAVPIASSDAEDRVDSDGLAVFDLPSNRDAATALPHGCLRRNLRRVRDVLGMHVHHRTSQTRAEHGAPTRSHQGPSASGLAPWFDRMKTV